MATESHVDGTYLRKTRNVKKKEDEFRLQTNIDKNAHTSKILNNMYYLLALKKFIENHMVLRLFDSNSVSN